jgi:hypothetical protein
MKPESRQSNETFPHRTERPGEAGLANEVRPGLGSRKEETKGRKVEETKKPTEPKKGKGPAGAHDHEPRGRNAPLPPREPREQRPGTMEREEERDTGVSGHSSGD